MRIRARIVPTIRLQQVDATPHAQTAQKHRRKKLGRKLGGGQADLLADLAHLLVHAVEHPGQIPHDPADQYLLEPLGDFLEYLVHGPPSLAQQREPGQQAHEGREKLKERSCNRKDFHNVFLQQLLFTGCF